MKKKAAKASLLAAVAIFFSTSLALGHGLQTSNVTVRAMNVTVVPKQPAGQSKAETYPISARERQNIQNTVRVQLDALITGNAQRAFANLAPSAQKRFERPGNFFNVVMEKTPPLMKTRDYSFIDGLHRTRNQATQEVLLTDRDGHNWIAKFTVQQQPTGQWRVSSCVVENMVGQEA